MTLRDHLADLTEIIGSCDESVLLRTATSALELISNAGLFDPLIGYMDFTVTGGNFFALPRDVRTPIRLNINQNQAFARHKLFEFSQNTPGTVEGDEIGWSWADRGTLPINDERPLPGRLAYQCEQLADEGKTITVRGMGEDSRERVETLIASVDTLIYGASTFIRVDSVRREETNGTCYLLCGADPLARYYADETVPRYRVVKLSINAGTVRMIYRRELFKVRTLDDVLPVDSPMGLKQACRAARFMLTDQYELAGVAEASAVKFVGAEQATRDEHLVASSGLDIATAIDSNIGVTEGLIVADVYDIASEIFGPIGRQKLFDRITDAVEALSRMGSWDSSVGQVDVWKAANSDVTVYGRAGSGVFVLPRFVEAVEAVSICGIPREARNKWYEFHLNGTGGSSFPPCLHWDNLDDRPIIANLPIDNHTREPVPVFLIATCTSAQDVGKTIIVHGMEMEQGRLKKVIRNGADGYAVTIKASGSPIVVEDDAPGFVLIERVEKPQTLGYVKLYAFYQNP